MYETEWEINVNLTLFTTVRAGSSEEDANEAARDLVQRLMKKAELQEDEYEIVEFDTYDCNRVEID
tara:strand:- start:637 stop:834 length:198 start_codon:yes stop_codon:yes gene_type:complete